MGASAVRRGAVALAAVLSLALTGCIDTRQPAPTALPLRPTATAEFETADLVELVEELIAAGAPAALIEVRDGDEVWSHAAGVMSYKSELPANPTATFRIASLTKPMIGTIVLQLVDEGRIQLDDDVAMHVPGPLDGYPAVTVRQLLNHTAGLPDYVSGLGTDDPTQLTASLRTARTHEELLALGLAKPWPFAPGEGFDYSNTNFIALSMLIEQVTGNPLATELQERITEPLGLNNTRLPSGTALGSNHAHGYWVESNVSVDVSEQDASLWSGAGGIESNVTDVNTFLRALMTGQVVPPELLGEMLLLGPDGYGLGIQARVDSCEPGDAVTLPLDTGEEPTVSDPAVTDAGEDADGSDTAEEPAPAATDPDAAPDTELDSADNGAADATDAADPALETAPPSTEGDPDELSDDTLDSNPPSPTSGSLLREGDGPLTVQIGAPGYVYGHLGSGLGYRAVTFTSPDGIRQVTIAWTASPSDYAADPRLPIAYRLADAALAVRC